jgi:hypothetical protein
MTPNEMFKSDKQRTDAMLSMQQELLRAYEQGNSVWLARLKSEADCWSELTMKLIGSRSIPDAMSAYQDYVTHHVQMAAEDGQRISEQTQRIMKAFAGGLSNGLPSRMI